MAVAAATAAAAPATHAPAGRGPVARRFDSPESYTPKHLAEKILTSRSAVEGERKQVTVLFTDVSGFTAISERLDPEEVHGIMDRTFEVILGAVHRYEGTINQFLGDGVMALFGAPIAHEDHSHRALRAALAIQDELRAVRDDVRRTHGVDFQLRIGINTGLVVVGAIGRDLRMDYTAVGDTTNLAARLLALAKPGQIVISEHAHQLTAGFFAFEELGEFMVKGKTAAVQAFAVTAEIRGRTRLEVSRERGLTPLAGRQTELARLDDAYQRAAAGRGAVVLLTGEPGVGKSRLLYEFLHRVEGRGALELETSCLSYGRSMPYHPVLTMLRAGLGVTEGMPEARIRERLLKTLRLNRLDDEESQALIAHFLGLPTQSEFLVRLQGPQLKERTFQVLTQMLVRASGRRPVIMVVENIHWADESSLEFFATLTRSATDHRVLLVLSTRPGALPPWLSAAEGILLEGLDPANVSAVVRSLLSVEEPSEALLHVLIEKSDGNPLYLEEILRQLSETRAIVIEHGRARLEGAVKVPETIHDIIAARVDRLPDTLKETLQAAAIVGRQFPVELVTLIVEEEAAVLDRLENLHRLDFVFPTAREPHLVYAFKHALTQEVVYSGLLERRRRVYHGTVAEGLEAMYSEGLEEILELLAYHFGRSADVEKGVDYAIRAGGKAQRRWAHAEALAHFGEALKRLDTMPDMEGNRLRRIDAVVQQSEIMFALGRHGEHVRALEAIHDLVRAAADPPRRAAWCYWTGFLHSITGARPDTAIAYCREALAIADASDLEEIRAFAESCLTHVYSVSGDLRDGLAAGKRALAAFEARRNVWWMCRTLWGLMSVANGLGEWNQSLEYCRRALEYGQSVNDLRLKVVGWWRTGSTQVQRGDPESGLRCCEEALALSPIPFDKAMVQAVRGYGMIKLGKFDAGMAELVEALEWLERSRLGHFRWLYGYWLVEGHLRRGDRSRARILVEEILGPAREESRRAEGVGERLLGESLMQDDPTAAASHLETARRMLEEIGARNEIAKALAALGEVRQIAGEVGEARQLLHHALTIFEELGTLDEPPRVRAALAGLRR